MAKNLFWSCSHDKCTVEPLGEERLTMAASVLFKKADGDASGSVSYIEYSKYIYHSTKHGPDAFRKADKNSDGVFDQAEFVGALSEVSWWKLSRKTPEEQFAQADVNEDGTLDMKEFASICTNGNHIEIVFKHTDRDQSDSLSQGETLDYIRSVTHGKRKNAKVRQQD